VNEETEERKGADKMFEELSIKAPERKVELEEDGEGKVEYKTLAEKMEETSDLSDMQIAIANLFPGDLGGKIYNALMIARVAPDVFMPLLKLLVNEEIKKSDPHQNINVASIVAKVYTLLSIGLDGKGRIDHIELAGASKETEELEKLGKGLFGT